MGRRTGHGHAACAVARAAMYRLLAEGCAYPTEDGIALLAGPYAADARAAAPILGDPVTLAGVDAFDHALAGLDVRSAERAYVATFGHTGVPLVAPYEAPYLTTNVFQESAGLADVCAFYRAFHVEPSAVRRERADHVAVELEFMHLLSSKEAHARRSGHGSAAVAICEDAQREFLRAHLGRWGASFFGRLRAVATWPHYGALGFIGEGFLAAEAARAGAVAAGQAVAVAQVSDDDGWCPLPLVTST